MTENIEVNKMKIWSMYFLRTPSVEEHRYISFWDLLTILSKVYFPEDNNRTPDMQVYIPLFSSITHLPKTS